jgi:hypothetical protein
MGRLALLRRQLPAAAAFPPPVLSNPTTDGQWDTAFASADYVGFTRHLEVFSDAGLTTLVQELIKPITEIDFFNGTSDWSIAAEPPPRDPTTLVITGINMGVGQRWWRERVERDDGVNSDWSNVLTATLVDPLASTLWRLRINNTAAGTYVGIADVVLRETIGDPASAIAGVTAVGCSTPAWDATATGDKAVDGNAATYWFSDSDGFPHTLTFTLPIAKGVREVLITAMTNPNQGYCCGSTDVQRWNGSVFATVFSFSGTGAGSWGSSETRTFHV